MPKQETFFEQQVGERRIEVLKSYDQGYAHEAFKNMDEQALRSLWASLKPEEIYDPAGLPSLTDPNDLNGEAEAFLWDELLEQAREDGSREIRRRHWLRLRMLSQPRWRRRWASSRRSLSSRFRNW